MLITKKLFFVVVVCCLLLLFVIVSNLPKIMASSFSISKTNSERLKCYNI